VDDTIGGSDISREVFESSEGDFSDDSVVDEILSEGTLVCKGLSSEVGEGSSSNLGRRNVSCDNVGSAAVGIEGSEVLFVGLDGGVGGSEDGEWSSSGDFGSNTSGLEACYEEIEVIVSLEVRFFLSDSNTISSPYLSRSLESREDINDGSSGGRGSSGRCSSSRGGGSRGGGGRSGGSRGTSVTHLQVLLEGRGGRDTLARIFVLKSIGVTGISHTSGSDFGSVEESGGDTRLLCGREGGGASDEGGNKGNFALEVVKSRLERIKFCEINRHQCILRWRVLVC